MILIPNLTSVQESENNQMILSFFSFFEMAEVHNIFDRLFVTDGGQGIDFPTLFPTLFM